MWNVILMDNNQARVIKSSENKIYVICFQNVPTRLTSLIQVKY